MRPDRMTTKSQEAFRAAADLASRRGNPEITPEHLIRAMFEQEPSDAFCPNHPAAAVARLK